MILSIRIFFIVYNLKGGVWVLANSEKLFGFHWWNFEDFLIPFQKLQHLYHKYLKVSFKRLVLHIMVPLAFFL